MSRYRCAYALDALLSEVDARAPHRDKASDGWIGDAAHASRESDHNPWVRLGSIGIVTARDIDHDPAHGADMGEIVEEIRARRDYRVKYLIFQGRICRSYPAHGLAAWQWGPYNGPNAHRRHLHISVKPERSAYDDTRRWLPPPPRPQKPPRDGYPAGDKPTSQLKPPPAEMTRTRRTLRLGMRGEDVAYVQRFVGGTAADGVYGPDTARAVRAYQRMRGIAADGIVGPITWRHVLGLAGR